MLVMGESLTFAPQHGVRMEIIANNAIATQSRRWGEAKQERSSGKGIGSVDVKKLHGTASTGREREARVKKHGRELLIIVNSKVQMMESKLFVTFYSQEH